MPMYRYPRARPACAMVSIEPAPSLHVECICKSPLYCFAQLGLLERILRAWASVRKLRRKAGGSVFDGGFSHHRRSSRSRKGPTAGSSCNDSSPARRASTSFGQRNAAREAFRKARCKCPVACSASKASHSAISALEIAKVSARGRFTADRFEFQSACLGFIRLRGLSASTQRCHYCNLTSLGNRPPALLRFLRWHFHVLSAEMPP